jgi:hypothetical protein
MIFFALSAISVYPVKCVTLFNWGGEVVMIMEIIQDGCDRGGHWKESFFQGKREMISWGIKELVFFEG